MEKYVEINSQALGISLAITGLIGWIIGLVWHGPMGQPTMMGMMYQGFSFMNPMNSVSMLLLFVVGGYIAGELVARFYNWALKKKR